VTEVVVLRPGYARDESSGTTRAAATVTLVRSDELRIIVDTGGPAERDVILAALANHNHTPREITHVVCTHGHIDHVGNNNLFPNAMFLMGQDRSVRDAFRPLDFSEMVAAGVQVVATPGHTSEDISLLVDTENGVVAIVGDLFEAAADDGDWTRYSRDPNLQRRSRTEILARADFIVPGHGDMFPVTRGVTPSHGPRR
jgi:glyoxylase-like metal-dependent hydrolase (beta-lactamase superfamily II)